MLNFVRNLINIPNLMNLSLTFQSRLTREAFKKVNESIENLVSLKQICLDLSQ